MNLLPTWLQQKKARRLLLIRMATAQVAIFFILGTIMLIATTFEQHVQMRSDELEQRLLAFSPEAAEAAAKVYAQRATAERLDTILRVISPVPFHGDWLPYILQTVPANASIIALHYRDGELVLTGTVSNISAIETHRINMQAQALFSDVRLGSVTLTADVQYRYEIIAWVGDN
ncbi:MAG: hypothetical protein FWE05_10840 [Defluviitaleaceae bacterium]|nr:hypothetical protein [Defluviitaleaceae bacterium]